MADYTPDIKTLIPQGPPFVMVDRLLGSDGSTTRTSFRITTGNPLTANGQFGLAGLIENMAQTAAAGAGYEALVAAGGVQSGAAPGGAIVAINNLEIIRLPEAGEELFTEVTVTARVADIVVISGQITCGQMVIARGEMKILTGI
ncbi:MAG TPA: 3-hydroxyacyl-ACP dehydratase [Puia sp.]|jgi:predicted hotdog family 3-hydroxylacyl-ACP dehydratase|nr:3-hydroxyacyl-ACP dehydratase [Puia sp.]